MALLPTADSFVLGPAVSAELTETKLPTQRAVARRRDLVAAAARALGADGAAFAPASIERMGVAGFSDGIEVDLGADGALMHAALPSGSSS